MCWASGWPTPMRWPIGRIFQPSPWAAGSSSPVISSWRGLMNRQPKRRKYFSGYFKDSVVFVCVAISARRRNACEQPSKARRLASRKGGMNDGKETSKRRGQHPEKAQRPMGGQIHPGHRPQHRPRHPEKRVRQDTGRMQRETGESHPGQPWYPGEPQRGLHGGGVVPAMV